MKQVSRVSLIIAGAATISLTLAASSKVNAPFADRDVVGTQVNASEIRTYAEGRRFNDLGSETVLNTIDGVERARVSVAAVVSPARDSMELAEGRIIGKIRSDRTLEDLGVSPGTTYVWVDRRGPMNHPWRMVMISSDGASRHVLRMVYTEHQDPEAFKAHQQEYCNGSPGCFVKRALSTATNANLLAKNPWFPCAETGCCRVWED